MDAEAGRMNNDPPIRSTITSVVAFSLGSAILHSMMNRIQDGERIRANRLGHIVTGTVESSRVAHAGKLQYTVNLDQPVQYRWRSEPTTRVLVYQEEIL